MTEAGLAPRPTAPWARHVVEPATPLWELARYAAAMTLVGLAFASLLYGVADRGDSVEAVEADSAIAVDLASLPSAQPATQTQEGPEQPAATTPMPPAPPIPIETPPPPAPATPDAVPEPKAQVTPSAAPSATARVAQAPSGTQVPVKADTPDGEDGHPPASAHAITAWQRALVGRIETAKRNLAPPGHAVGTVSVSFVIDRSGHIVSETLTTPSGSAAIDQAALDLIRSAAPFPTPPDGVLDKNLSFVVPIRFRRR